MSRAHMLVADSGLDLGAITIPMWSLWVLALVVVLLIVGFIVFRLARRARKIARASRDGSQGAGENDGTHSFGSYGAVTSAISITPDVKSKSRNSDSSKSDD